MTKKEAYQMVLDDLSKCDLFVGICDAKNGKESFMYGISTVMEAIAYSIDEETGDKFSDMFIKNLIDSEAKV